MPDYLAERYVLKVETVLIEDVEDKNEARDVAYNLHRPKLQHSDDIEVDSVERVYK